MNLYLDNAHTSLFVYLWHKSWVARRLLLSVWYLNSQDNSQPRTRSWRQVCQSPYHHRTSHQQRAAMARFPKLPPVVFVAVQLPIFLIVPVREGILTFRAPWRKQKNKVPVSNKSQFSGECSLLRGENTFSSSSLLAVLVTDVLNPTTWQYIFKWRLAPRFVRRGGTKQFKGKDVLSKFQRNPIHFLKHISWFTNYAV